MADRWAGLAARAPVTSVFVMLGLSAGTWAARIPAIKDGLHLSPGILGLTLLGPAIGSVLTMPLTGAVLATVPPRRVVQWGLLGLGGLLPVTTFASSAWQLFAVLAGWGAGLGAVDVAMNVEASAVQDRLGRRAMSGFHAAYSVGGLAGAGLGGVAAASGLSARADFLAASAVVLLAGGLSAHYFTFTPPGHGARRSPPAGGDPAAQGAPRHGGRPARAVPPPAPEGLSAPRVPPGPPPVSRWPQWSWALVFLAVMSASSFLAEGAATDWSAVYLHSSLGASVGLAAVGYTVFSCTMTAGRLAGDRLADRAGAARLIRLSAGTATAGFAAALLIGQVWSGLAGFALLGAGLSVVVPLVFSAAAALGRPGPNLALVTSAGYVGMLTGPALIGGVAQVLGLHAALGIVVALCLMITALAGVVRPRSGPPADGPGPPADGPRPH